MLCLLLSLFLIEFRFKDDAFENEFNKKRPQEEPRESGEDIASYLNRHSRRNDERRRQEEEIASYLNRNSPQEEARQPGEDIAYLNRNSTRNNHRMRQGSQERILLHIE
jgi:hypothetical protein